MMLATNGVMGACVTVMVLNCGVQQGRCLGPLLLSVFTNDLPYGLHEAIIPLYAHASTLYWQPILMEN